MDIGTIAKDLEPVTRAHMRDVLARAEGQDHEAALKAVGQELVVFRPEAAHRLTLFLLVATAQRVAEMEDRLDALEDQVRESES